ncbi:pentatricopeptide repeat-containing protein At4g25270, chloroplastic [Mercurialis annua]|uniref:pentatricopeptide repeat-containing protein At4g25270, chloroplastic n=1 Tax=Mercurialis annua TaxID=3986 RepID=UPI00215EA721|nr:pentatricopeptide repeat-containing protein At4g25270, chloroplastic [Mercurialis annua]XP_050223584.1 pentatricopeptide repeat-containing protein At4g25270, chloroplastic [Mercurialis annua]XP_050223585.1 pentatricopeptide repeat-containing protein At4g25270, chloroplastic [Mercurialis annua]
MTTVVLPPIFLPPSMMYHYASGNKQRREKRRVRRIQKKDFYQNTNSFPVSPPTPLLINPQTYTQTKLQALDNVVEDLEASVKKGIKIDTQILSSLLETCYRLNSIDHGVRVHRLIPAYLLRKNTGIASKLLRLYASFGFMDEAHQMFDEMPNRDKPAFAWNSLIAGYAEIGLYEDAIALYFQMEEEQVESDEFTFPRVLKACGGIGLIRVGEAVHRDLIRLGFGEDGFVLNALVDMYAKCGDILKARRIFEKMACKDSVSWNSMLTGYVSHGLIPEALKTIRRMLQDGFELDSVAISSLLGNVSSLNVGVQIHGWIVRREMMWDLSVANSLIAMYSSNGKLERARWIFDNMQERDVVSWNSIISAHCKSPEVLSYFDRMENSGALPDNITFVSVLSACAHLGLVRDGERLFALMIEKYGIQPIKEHYACMVNLYGRSGLISKAHSLIDNMEFDAGPTVWGALLYGCYLHGNVDIGEIAAQRLFELEPDNEHNFELLMKIYGDAGRLKDVERVKTMMMDRGL